EEAVRHAVAASDTEAVDLHVVDFVAATLPELLAKADGRQWIRGAEHQVLKTRDLPSERVEPGFRLRLLAMLVDPNIAYILMMIGFYGILFELQIHGVVR